MLSLAKHCLGFVIPPFALMQKVEPKNQGKPEPLRASCPHAQKQSLRHSSFTYFVPSSLFPYASQLFRKTMPFLLV
jgi:hypothetical protein